MLVIRSSISFALMIAWPLATLYVMNSTWRALDVPLQQILALIAMLALLAPVTALAVAAFAANKVEALAIFKGVNFAGLAPLALYFLPADASYRAAFLLTPTGWGVFAFEAFRAGDAARGYLHVIGGAVYLLILLALCVRSYLASVYKTAS
jgi:fluoroquinolone transport system permease protein